MSAYLVNAATIDAIISGARQYGGQGGFSFVRLFPGAGYSFHKFSRYAADDEAPGVFNPDTLGRELWGENLRSVHARYPDTADSDDSVPGTCDGFTSGEVIGYQYGPGSRVVEVDPLGLLGAIRGYEYQSCEHSEWGYSVAKAAVDALSLAVVHYLIDGTGANAWTIDALREVTGETRLSKRDGGGWTISFTPGESVAVSLFEQMVRGR